MIAYLDKTLSIFNEYEINCITCNGLAGWLGIGGSSGLLCIVNLNDYAISQSDTKDVVINDSNIPMHTLLEGHSGFVTHLAWNEAFEKLASTDSEGLTIVWSVQEESWCQDMANNQNHSFVTDMKWSSDGELISIIYHNGTVIIGSVEGSKLWGLKLGVSLKCVQWSPSNKNIVFVTEQSELKVYDKIGNHIRDILDPGVGDICKLHWSNSTRNRSPKAAIYGVNGNIKIVSTIYEAKSTGTFVDSKLGEGMCCWSPNGQILAVCGKIIKSETKMSQTRLQVRFYTSDGNYLCNHQLFENEDIVGMEWEYSSMRIAIATTKKIHLLNVRSDYAWTTLNSNSTLVWQSFENEKVYFSSEKHSRKIEKSFGDVLYIHGGDKYCVVFSSTDNDNKIRNITANICDEVGTIVSSKGMVIQPDHVSVNNRVMVAADHRNVYMHIFNSMNRRVDSFNFHSYLYKNASGMERMFDIHDLSINPSKPESSYVVRYEKDNPRITATYVTNDFLLVSKANNTVVFLTYPNITRLCEVHLQTNIPKSITANCDYTTFGFTDEDDSLFFYELYKNNDSKISLRLKQDGSKLSNIWALKWSTDDPSKCVIQMEGKIQEIYFLSEHLEKHDHLTPNSTAYLMFYSELEIELVNFVHMINNPYSSPHVVRINSKQMEKVEKILSSKDSCNNQLFSNIQDSRRDKGVLKILGSKCVERQDYSAAIQAFSKLEDFIGISFIERISSQEASALRQAEIFHFDGQLQRAEENYLEINKYDLAIRMYIDLGDWNSAKYLLDQKKVEDSTYRELCTIVAEHLFQHGCFAEASKYYGKAGNEFYAILSLIRCRDYTSIQNIMNDDGSDVTLWQKLMTVFLCNGIYRLAVLCQSKMNNDSSIETMIGLRQWEKVIELSKVETKEIVLKHIKEESQGLLRNNEYLDALELCQSTGLVSDAAEILLAYHDSESKENRNIILSTRKKMFVLAAINVDIYQKREIDLSKLKVRNGNQSSSNIVLSIEKMMYSESSSQISSKMKRKFRKIWRDAAAHHYFQLAHQKLYEGDMEIAMKAGIRCCEYLDILSPLTVYSLVAIASFKKEYFLACSICFSKLITMESLDEETTKEFRLLGYAIFMKHDPVNKKNLPQCYTDCLEMGKAYDACTISGSNITNKQAIQCKYCGYYMLEEEALHRNTCALCHGDCNNAETVTLLGENERTKNLSDYLSELRK